MRMCLTGTLAVCLLAGGAAAQDRPKYLDIMTVKVKADKRADFDAVCRKIADANRRHKGDRWLALANVYGEANTFRFVSRRSTMAEVEQSYQAFERAMKEAFGSGSQKVFQDFGATVSEMRNEVRVQRYDLMRNAPENPADFDRMLGAARWMRTLRVDVRRPKVADFEASIGEILDALHKSSPQVTTLASMSMLGGDGGIQYYFTMPVQSLAELDKLVPMKQALGPELFSKFQRMDAEDVATTQWTLARMVPEISNPPDAVVEVSREFWTPKPQVAAARRAKPAAPAADRTQ